ILKHIATLAAGFLLTFLIHRINYNFFFKIAKILPIVTIPLLLLTLIMGVSLNSAARWITIPGLGLTFQSSDFAKLVLLANVIAWPAAYYVMKEWLATFVYHTDISILIFIVSGAVTLSIAILTVAFQAFSAANANPIRSLKYE
ncbi:MAG TPA: FtsW/RodA/SpoVE family cell cycle protein, partial [bacterium]|nr:FtsW/RodA/SpoVE family cell cycle protein [bacterium]